MYIGITGGFKQGDTFTIEGCGRGAKGQVVWAGRNVATGRKCKVVALTVYRAGKTLGAETSIKPLGER